MKNLNTTHWIIGGLLGAGIITYLLLREDQKKVSEASKPALKRKPTASPVAVTPSELILATEQQPVLETKPEPQQVEVEKPIDDDSFPLQLGSIGKRVERLKIFLMRNFGAFGQIDQSLDEKTVARMQKHLGIDQLDEATFNRYKMGNHVMAQSIIR